MSDSRNESPLEPVSAGGAIERRLPSAPNRTARRCMLPQRRRMRRPLPLRRPLALALALLLAAVAGGCGGDGKDSGPKTFDEKEFGITFQYPGEFDLADKLVFRRSAGLAATASRAVRLDDQNLLGLQRFDLRTVVTEENLDRFLPGANRLFTQLAGKKMTGKKVEFGGLPGFQYELLLHDIRNGRTRATLLFDGKVEYLLNCQSTPPKRPEITRACDQALRTLKSK